MTQHWNVSFQKQYGENWSVTASYFGNRTTHMWNGMEINPGVYIDEATAANLNQRRLLSLQNPDQGRYFASVTQLDQDGRAHYNGLLLALQKRISDNYSLNGNYTLSKCMNDSDPQQFLDPLYSHPGDPHADWGPCAGDRRHVINTTLVVNTPTFASGARKVWASSWQASATSPDPRAAPAECDHRPRQGADRRAEPASERHRRLEAGRPDRRS